eukprot:14887848-Ditylum_brightwellii.AAC.1
MQGKAGTIRYMAPEMKCNKTYDASVDVYSFDNDDDRKGKIDDKVKMRPDLSRTEGYRETNARRRKAIASGGRGT